jgi:phage gp46-like protein
MAEIASAAVETGRSIGRYFAVISMVPSLLFVLYIYGLFAAGAWSGDFEPAKALHAFESLSVGEIVALIAAALLFGLVLHPFQFPMTQLLEGYWGASGIGLRLARHRIKHYRRAVRALEDAADYADEVWEGAVETARAKQVDIASEDPQERTRNNIAYLDAKHGDPMLAHYLRAQAIRAVGQQYPEYGRRMMPTRLGNVLRRYEDKAGQQYGLNILRVAPHLNLIAVKEHREYVDDCRKGLDLSVRLCALFALATALSVGLLADDGAWLLLALAPYCVSYLAYRGAVSSAQAYGSALSTLVDLNRFALYEQLHIPPPSSTEVERNRNEQLLKLLSGKPPYFLRYRHSKNASP